MKNLITCLTVCVLSGAALVASNVQNIASAGVAAANDPVQWQIEDGGNGHWYQAVVVGKPVTWTDAHYQAKALGGYLVTLTSESEDQWLFKTLVNNTTLWNSRSGPLIGAYQNLKSPFYSEPDGGWEWVTGEPWNYANWQDGQPDNWGGDEHFAHFKAVGDGPPLDQWNDLATPTLIDPIAFIVEYDNIDCPADINGDGSVGITDLLAVIDMWGCSDCTDEDVNLDGIVNRDDLVIVIGNWGACP